MSDLKRRLGDIGDRVRERFEAQKRVLSFEEFLGEFNTNPFRHTRDAARYLRDCFDFYGTTKVHRPFGDITRYRLFDLDFEHDRGAGSVDYLVGHEEIQESVYRALSNFVREGRANRLVLLHGPNGSAKSTFANCLMRALEHYSNQPDGALYRFSWIFPRGTDGKAIGFGSRDDGPRPGDSYAHLADGRIEVKLQSSSREHPLLLLPRAERTELVLDSYKRAGVVDAPPQWITRGLLGHKDRQIFEALLTAYRGDLARVLAHVRIERYTISKRYRVGAVTIGPQMAVDASERQITADHSLAALPASLSALTLFEPYGELVDACGGLVEYSDLLKRPLDAWKYLLLAIETGEVSLPLSTLAINAVMLASSNELHLQAFREHPDFHSFRGRIQLVRVPYLRDFRQEQAIYDAQVAAQVRTHVAPHATFVAALWAVLSRVRRPSRESYADPVLGQLAEQLTPLEKALLYSDGSVPKRFNAEQTLRLKHGIEEIYRESWRDGLYEGLTGASPREMRTLLLDAAQHPDFQCLSPLGVLASLGALTRAGDYDFLKRANDHGYHDHMGFVTAVADRWLDRVDDELRDSTGLVEEQRYVELFDRYITHVSHWIKNETIYNRLTGDHEKPDVELMRHIERIIAGGEEEAGFRKGLISQVAGHAIDHPGEKVDYPRVFPTYIERVREEYFGEHKARVHQIAQDVLLLLTESDTRPPLDPERAEHAKMTFDNLCQRHGYVKESARDALGELLRRRYGT